MEGEVTADREARIRLVLRGFDRREVEIDAVIDTGFTDALTLPLALITELGLPFRNSAQAILADGSRVTFDVHKGTVLWNSEWTEVYVDAVDSEPLLGMGLLYGNNLNMDVVDGGAVIKGGEQVIGIRTIGLIGSPYALCI